MKLYDVNSILSKKNEGYIVLIRCGIFFVGIGENAVALKENLNTTPVCFKENICKCGIPVSSIQKYVFKLKETGLSYVIYDYDKNGFENGENYKEIIRIEGKKYKEKRKSFNCNECWYKKNRVVSSIEENLKILEKMQKKINE